MRILAQKSENFFLQPARSYAVLSSTSLLIFCVIDLFLKSWWAPIFAIRFFEFPVITSSFSGATVVSICKCRGTYFELDTTQCVVFNKNKLQKVNALILHMQLISCKKFDRGHQEISFSHFWLKMTQCVL